MTEHDEDDRGSQMTSQISPPPITDALRAQARRRPGEWVYAVDPEFEGSDRVPPEGIVGAWRSDERGEVTGDFTPNPRYVPSPAARGWAQPTSRLERVLQLVRAGHAPGVDLDREFAAADVLVYSRPEGGLFVARDGDAGVIYAFSDAAKATASGYDQFTTMTGRELATALPSGVRIALNPGADVGVAIEPADVLAAG